jgi:predicted phage terminase large subunit-like protein
MLRRRIIRTDLTAWCEHALAPHGQTPAAHHRLLIAEMERVERGGTPRLMVLMPPGSAKSTYVSALFPAWFLARHPAASVIAASHTTMFARRWGRRVRNLIAEHAETLGYGLAPDEAAADRWSTTAGGEYGAFGVGAAVTGRRADLLILDDVVAGQEAADSETQRENVWEWYRRDLYTRLKPGGAIVLVMTRWHSDDLGGRLLDDAKAGGEQWRVLCLPALAEADDALGRALGAPLWPAWQSVEALAAIRGVVGERGWWALYQQSPRSPEGAIFRVAQIATLDAAPACAAMVRAWDLAATAATGGRDPDWTAGVRLGRTAEGRWIVLDVLRLRGGPEDVEAAIVNTAAQDGRASLIGLPQDPGQAGRSQVLYLTRKLAGYRVESSPETGDKATRAMPVASQCNVGNLAIVRAPWNAAFIAELRDFPSGSHDDSVDALSRAFANLTAAPTPPRVTRLGY